MRGKDWKGCKNDKDIFRQVLKKTPQRMEEPNSEFLDSLWFGTARHLEGTQFPPPIDV